METQIYNKDLLPIPFKSKRNVRFTYAQLKLIQYCNEKIKLQETISFQEMRRFWLTYAMTDKWIESWNKYQRQPKNRYEIISHFDKDDEYYIGTDVLQWFRLNIGTLVLKGALVALPVINIDECVFKDFKN